VHRQDGEGGPGDLPGGEEARRQGGVGQKFRESYCSMRVDSGVSGRDVARWRRRVREPGAVLCPRDLAGCPRGSRRRHLPEPTRCAGRLCWVTSSALSSLVARLDDGSLRSELVLPDDKGCMQELWFTLASLETPYLGFLVR